jgi:hypothetical protein
MHTICELPTDLDLSPIQDLMVGRPNSWQGMSVEWLSEREPAPVFLGQFSIPNNNVMDYVYLFGARYNLSEALLGGQSLGAGYFVEYFVASNRSKGGWRLHRLLQRQSVTFSESDEKKKITCRP